MPTSSSPRSASPRDSSVQTIERTLAILEFIAERGGAAAREISEALGYPLPTVYRLMQALVQAEYLTHLRSEHRFELGFKLDRLGASLHRQVGVPSMVRSEIQILHDYAKAAAYFAIYRGTGVVLAYVVDSPRYPRLQPLRFGFHEAAHATAFGKIMLSGMSAAQRNQYLEAHGTSELTPTTITDRTGLERNLAEVGNRGIAWEREEFIPGMTCAAIGVRNGAGMVVGSVAISTPSQDMSPAREKELERRLRDAANRISRYYRTTQAPID